MMIVKYFLDGIPRETTELPNEDAEKIAEALRGCPSYSDVETVKVISDNKDNDAPLHAEH